MTNPNDSWRHQSPAAPHAPPHDRLTPGPPLQPGQPAPSFNDSSQPYAASPGAGSGAGVLLFCAFVVLVFSGPIFGSLYPLAAGVALVAGLVTDGVLRVAARTLDASSRLPIDMLAALVVFWPMMRLDHRLATTVPPYRLARHVARVFLIAAFISMAMANESGGQWMPRSIGQLRALADSRHLAVMAVAAVFAHWFLTRRGTVHARWDEALGFVRLRPN